MAGIITEEYEDHPTTTDVWVVPPHTYEDTFEPAIGPMKGTVEVLRPDCSVVVRLTLQTGVMDIDSQGNASLRYFTNEDTEFPSGLFEEVARCGGMETRPPGTTPQP